MMINFLILSGQPKLVSIKDLNHKEFKIKDSIR